LSLGEGEGVDEAGSRSLRGNVEVVFVPFEESPAPTKVVSMLRPIYSLPSASSPRPSQSPAQGEPLANLGLAPLERVHLSRAYGTQRDVAGLGGPGYVQWATSLRRSLGRHVIRPHHPRDAERHASPLGSSVLLHAGQGDGGEDEGLSEV